jgi:hypothetical protein
MKHRSTQALFAYWNKQRGNRPAPDRGDIDPVDIRHQLGDTFMLAADFVDTLRFRLAGTRVCALFNRELKGEAFNGLWDEASTKMIDALATVVIDEQAGAVAGVSGRTADGAEIDLELLLLPLAHKGHARIRALGVLAPTAPPYWLGDKPVVELTLGAIRHIGADLDNADAPHFSLAPAQTIMAEPARLDASLAPQLPVPEGARRRHGFVVYSGGREPPSSEQTG